MTKQKRLTIHQNRQKLSEEERLALDEKLFYVADHLYEFDNAYDAIKSLLEMGADPNFYHQGKTVVHLFSRDYLKYLQLAVEYGGDLTKTTQKVSDLTDYGYTPLHLACSHGLRENTSFILSQLQKIGKIDEVGHIQTALFHYSPRVSASQGSERASLHRLLDQYKIPHNLPDIKMRTELGWSAGFDDLEAISYLKENGSLAILYGQNGRTYKASETPQLSTEAKKLLTSMEKEEQMINNNSTTIVPTK